MITFARAGSVSVVLALVALGCAHPAQAPTPRATLGDRNDAAPLPAPDVLAARAPEPPRSRLILTSRDERTVTLRMREEPTRPARRNHIDLSLWHADLENVARLLAEAGRFNLIIDQNLQGIVTLTLKHVEPYDALLAIARSQHAEVTYEGGIVRLARN